MGMWEDLETSRAETQDICTIDHMGSEIKTKDRGDNDAGEDWSSVYEFITPSSTPPETETVNPTRGYSQQHPDSHYPDTPNTPTNRRITRRREKLKTLKEKTINTLRHSGKDAEISPVGGAGSSTKSESNNLISPRFLISRAPIVLTHPRTALKASLAHIVAGRLSTLNAPYIPQAAEVEFVEAHDERDEARKNACPEDVEDAERRIEELVWRRRNMQVNWTMDRHVTSVMVAPTHRKERPRKSDFFVKDEAGNTIKEFENGQEKINYVKWLGQFLLYQFQDLVTHYLDDREQLPPITLEKTRSIIERLFVSTAPWQEWLLHVRRVYRWEDPYETFRWLVLYVVLWHYSYIVTFVWLCVVFFTLRRYIDPERKVGDLRDSIERARNTGKQAYKLGEVIEKHGPEEWLAPLADSLGPWAQVQLDDLANFLEILENFYEWRSPYLTTSSVFFFFCMFLLGLLTSTDFCMKLFFFMSGISFFLWFPVSSRYPRYRYIVSPFRWIFWNIPTHTEWALQELRIEAQNNREKIIIEGVEKAFWMEENDPEGSGRRPEYSGVATPSDEVESIDGRFGEGGSEEDGWFSAEETLGHPLDDGHEFASFKCRCGHHLGRLVICQSGIRFKSMRKHREIWNKTWLELVEMKKVGSTEPVGKLLSLEGLEISFTDGGVVRLMDMADRNEAFKWVTGYSGLRWRSNS